MRSSIAFLVVLASALAVLGVVLAGTTFADDGDDEANAAPSNLTVKIEPGPTRHDGVRVLVDNFVLTWTPGTDPEYDYQVIRHGIVPDSGPIEWVNTLTQTSTKLVHYPFRHPFYEGEFPDGEEVAFQIGGAVVDEERNLSWDDLSNQVRIRIPELTPPGRASGLQVTTDSRDVSVGWSLVNNATSYKVRWREAGPGNPLNDGVEVKAPTAAITVDEDGDWVVRVEACNRTGCGPGSASRFTAETAPDQPPAGLQATTEMGSRGVSVDWNDVERAKSYLVRWRQAGSGDPLNGGVRVQSSDATITVNSGGKWVVRVEACNAGGCGPAAAKQFTVVMPPDQKPAGLGVTTQQGSLDAAVDWDEVDGADSYLVRWRQAGPGNPLNDGMRVRSSDAIITVADYGDCVVRVEACNAAGCGPGAAKRFTAVEQPNRAPVVDHEAANYRFFVATPSATSGNAPRGTMVSKSFAGIFSDPDDDELSYTVSVPRDRRQTHNSSGNHIELVDEIRVVEKLQRVFIRFDADADWGTAKPALPDPLITEVTLTATDPDGLSASVTGSFRTGWASHPVLLRAEADLLISNGRRIDLTFNQPAQSEPALTPGQFTVNVVNGDGSAGTIAVERVSVSGAVVTLDLAEALEEGQAVTVDYAHDDAAPLTRAAGGGDNAPGFTGQAVDMS